jgi:hypothetical protein
MCGHRSQIWSGVCLLLSAAILLSACSGMAGEAAMQVWMDSPLEGSIHQPGEPVIFMAHARDVNGAGITEIQFFLNGEKIVSLPTDSNSPLASASASWQASEGEYKIQARAVSSRGETVNGSSVHFSVRGPRVNGPDITDTPTPTLEITRTLTPTFEISITPTITRTFTPTFTPTYPLPLISFYADRTNINAGECLNLGWDASYVTLLYLDGVQVSFTGTQNVCPSISKSYQLSAFTSYGTIEKYVDVTVNIVCPAGRTSSSAELYVEGGACSIHSIGDPIEICVFAKNGGENLWTYKLIDIQSPYFDELGQLQGDKTLLSEGSLLTTEKCKTYNVAEPAGFEVLELRIYNYGQEADDWPLTWIYVVP